jgi:hypothetical protein
VTVAIKNPDHTVIGADGDPALRQYLLPPKALAFRVSRSIDAILARPSTTTTNDDGKKVVVPPPPFEPDWEAEVGIPALAKLLPLCVPQRRGESIQSIHWSTFQRGRSCTREPRVPFERPGGGSQIHPSSGRSSTPCGGSWPRPFGNAAPFQSFCLSATWLWLQVERLSSAVPDDPPSDVPSTPAGITTNYTTTGGRASSAIITAPRPARTAAPIATNVPAKGRPSVLARTSRSLLSSETELGRVCVILLGTGARRAGPKPPDRTLMLQSMRDGGTR